MSVADRVRAPGRRSGADGPPAVGGRVPPAAGGRGAAAPAGPPLRWRSSAAPTPTRAAALLGSSRIGRDLRASAGAPTFTLTRRARRRSAGRPRGDHRAIDTPPGRTSSGSGPSPLEAGLRALAGRRLGKRPGQPPGPSSSRSRSGRRSSSGPSASALPRRSRRGALRRRRRPTPARPRHCRRSSTRATSRRRPERRVGARPDRPRRRDAAGSLLPADIGSTRDGAGRRGHRRRRLRHRTAPRSWAAVFGLVHAQPADPGVIPGQVRLLRSLLFGREATVDRLILAGRQQRDRILRSRRRARDAPPTWRGPVAPRRRSQVALPKRTA